MLADGEYITRSFNIINVEVIAKIKCCISKRKAQLHEK